MIGAALDWSRYVAGLSRDLLLEACGLHGRCRPPHPTRYLSPVGLALSCDAFGGVPFVMTGALSHLDVASYRTVPDGGVLWTRAEALPHIVRDVLPHLRSRFVLVTGDSDWSVPSRFREAADALVASGQVRRWFSVNADGSAYADLITPMPLGLPYPRRNAITINLRAGTICVHKKTPAEHEAEWDAIVAAAPPLEGRRPLATADFHFNDTARSRAYGESRDDIRRALRDNPNVAWMPRRTTPAGLLRRYTRYAFVISPHGHGLDCFRTWEALLAGCIVIVKTSPLDALYRGLPVAIVRDWSEITADNLRRWLAGFGSGFDRGRTRDALSLAYWLGEIRAAARTPRPHSATSR